MNQSFDSRRISFNQEQVNPILQTISRWEGERLKELYNAPEVLMSYSHPKPNIAHSSFRCKLKEQQKALADLDFIISSDKYIYLLSTLWFNWGWHFPTYFLFILGWYTQVMRSSDEIRKHSSHYHHLTLLHCDKRYNCNGCPTLKCANLVRFL